MNCLMERFFVWRSESAFWPALSGGQLDDEAWAHVYALFSVMSS